MRPGSSRLGTGRLGTGRLGTGAGGGGGGVALGTDVRVTERPVTQQGMAGMGPRLQSAGPRRQVQDLTYFLGLLRGRISDVGGELERLVREIEQRKADAVQVQALERRYETVSSQVRVLEGELADHNLAMDKHRAHTDPAEIRSFRDALHRRNEEEARQIDRIFLRRREQEKGVERLQEQLDAIRSAQEARLEALGPTAKADYARITDRTREQAAKIAKMQAELEHLNLRVQEAEDELARDTHRDKFAKLERKKAQLREELQALEEESRATSLDPAAARERLLAKVKRDNGRIQELRGEAEELRGLLERRRRALRDVEADIAERQSGGGGEDKFEALFRRDQEMTEFLDRMGDAMGREEAEQRRARETIVALLEHVSVGLERGSAMPSRQEAGEMREDLGDKERELGESKETEERLREELAQRKEDLRKIDTLDEKIGIEMRSLQAKMETMRLEMPRLGDLDALREAATEAQATLAEKQEGYRRRRDALRAQAAAADAELEGAKERLASMPRQAELEAAEDRIRQYERLIFGMREDVVAKAKATEFEDAKHTCAELLREVNEKIKAAQREAVPSAAAALIAAGAAAGGGAPTVGASGAIPGTAAGH